MFAKKNISLNENPRPQRFISHALIEIKRYKFLPFFCHSAVLLDLSLGGFKIEFTGSVSAEPGQKFWISIPLSPLGIYAPKKIVSRCECRWFHPERQRMGGVFLSLNKLDQMLVEEVIDTIARQKGFF